MRAIERTAKGSAARDYAEDGKSTTALLEKVASYKEENPDILAVFQDPELEISSSVYLQEEHNISNVYNISYSKNDGNLFYDGWRTSSDEKEAIYGNEAQIYIGYRYDTDDFMVKYGVNPDDFNLYTFGEYEVYIQKSIEDLSAALY